MNGASFDAQGDMIFLEEHGVHSFHDSEIGGIHILKIQNFGAVLNCFVFTLVNGKGKKNVKPTTLKKERKERD